MGSIHECSLNSIVANKLLSRSTKTQNTVPLTNPLTLEQSKQLISSSASITLDRFCRWQADLNGNRTDEHPLHHDMAILLTRTDLCRSGHNCDTLGLAHSSKICDAKSSCAIVEDNGLSTALTIAHEIGHK